MRPDRRRPSAAKARSYEERQARGAKSVQGFRKGWPKKKAHAQRVFRRKLRAEADAVLRGADAELVAVAPPARRKSVRKWYVPTVRERVAAKQRRRVASAGAKLERRLAREHAAVDECEWQLRRLLRRRDVPVDHDLSDVVVYAARLIKPELPDPRSWDRFVAARPESVLRLREWRAMVRKRQAKLIGKDMARERRRTSG